MIFVIDVGNSHTVAGLFSGTQLLGQWRLKSDRKMTVDELAIQYHSLFAMQNIDTSIIEGVVLASVVPSLEGSWVACCEKYLFTHLKQPVLVISEVNVQNLITIALPNPEEVGADRLVNAIAAFDRHHCDLVVIDFGTAITFDCVSSTCSYLGGAIIPGISISLEALSTNTAKLPHIDVSTGTGAVIGKSTVEAMKSGILYGYGAMLDGMVEKIKREMGADSSGSPFQVIATGGMANLIAPYSTSIDQIDQLLTLEGLRIIYNATRDHV